MQKLVEHLCDGPATFAGGVLVAKSCLVRDVAEAVHGVLRPGTSTSTSGEGSGQVPQIVEVEVGRPTLLCLGPCAL